MRQPVFLDTSYLIALIRKNDMRHTAAMHAAGIYTGPFLTTNLVLVELANSLSIPPYRSTAVIVIEKIREDKNTTIIPFTSDGMTKALNLYKARDDKTWGMIDCFSFVTMAEKRLKRALTFDEHFRQAGFEVPLLD
jgi:predicted nucleic acid-binding protein